VLTVSAWLRASGSKKPAGKKTALKAAKGAKGSSELAAFKAALIRLINQF
jgi:hypothetical protein